MTLNGSLPDLPVSHEEMVRALPDGWIYLGPRDTPNGCRWEAASSAGVASAPTPGKLLHMIQQAERIRAGASVTSAEATEGNFNRRRKSIRRADKESTLERCLACYALVFGEAKAQHLQEFHAHLSKEACEQAFAAPQSDQDDGTGEDPTLDDPAVAMSVTADP